MEVRNSSCPSHQNLALIRQGNTLGQDYTTIYRKISTRFLFHHLSEGFHHMKTLAWISPIIPANPLLTSPQSSVASQGSAEAAHLQQPTQSTLPPDNPTTWPFPLAKSEQLCYNSIQWKCNPYNLYHCPKLVQLVPYLSNLSRTCPTCPTPHPH